MDRKPPSSGALLPINNYTEAARDVTKERDPNELRALNAWLRAFCKRRGYAYADYYAPLVDANGLMARAYTEDGVHPLDNGYARMVPVAERAIAQALRQKTLHMK